MKKTILIALIVSLFLASCEFQEPVGPIVVNYRVGYDGADIRFSIFPELEVYENEKFNVQLETWNRGAYDIDNAFMVLNFDRSAFIGDTSGIFRITEEINGRSVSYPEGEFATSPIINLTAKKIFLTDYQKFDFIAKICYGYSTQATIEACIGKKTGYRSCDFEDLNKGLNMSNGQGSPLAITQVDEQIVELGDKIKPRFTFVIENKGSGQVVRDPEKNIEPLCIGYGLGERVLDRFDLKLQLSTNYFYDSRSDVNSFTCRPTVPELENGKAEITCTLNDELEAGPAYITPLITELIYGYTDQARQELTVRRAD
jgi:hypothetical protein